MEMPMTGHQDNLNYVVDQVKFIEYDRGYWVSGGYRYPTYFEVGRGVHLSFWTGAM